jgi:DNA-binding NarL/FixJ family response regulator
MRRVYVDEAGRPVDLPGDGRAVTKLDDIAAIVHDPELDPGLVEAAGAAARLALHNARLQADVSAQLAKVQESRRRIVAAGDEERRKIERDLHDGAQQRLVALALELRIAQRQVGDADPELEGVLGRAVAELQVAVEELRELARGVHPAVLTEEGLAGALESLAVRTPVPVRVDAPDDRLPRRARGRGVLRRVRGDRERRQARAGDRDPCLGTAPQREAPDRGRGRRRRRRARERVGLRPPRPRRPRRGAWRDAPDRERAGRRDARDRRAAVRVVIADDSVLMREGVARVLGDAGMAVVASVGDADGLRRAVATEKPDVAIIDVRMPPTQTDEGARAAETIRERHPDVGVLMLSQIVEPHTALRLFGERPEGFGYLLKDRVLEIDDFVEAVRRVARGGTAMDPQIVSQLVGNRKRDDPVDELSPREREVLGLMAEGRSNAGICAKLFLSPKTVETHVSSIFNKLRLAQAPDDHRRVLAVLAYLRSEQ